MNGEDGDEMDVLRQSLRGLQLNARDEEVIGWVGTLDPHAIAGLASLIERVRARAAREAAGRLRRRVGNPAQSEGEN